MTTATETIVKFEPGIYKDITHSEYHGCLEGVTHSYLSRLDKCPANAKVKQEDTPNLLFGRAFHSYVLDGEDTFKREFAVVPNEPDFLLNKNTTKYKEAFAKFKESVHGKSIITQDQLTQIINMHMAVYSHPFASKLLSQGVSETTIIWKDPETGITCKGRPDRIPAGNKGVLVDLKKTADASAYGFQRSVANFAYDRQGAMWQEGMKELGVTIDHFVLIAVEDYEPYRVEVYDLDDDFLRHGHDEFHRLLKIESECRKNGYYPNYTNAGANVLMKPAYL